MHLLQPREPLAWSIDPSWTRGDVFRPTWHSERTPGARARPAERVALIEPARGPIAVRVWYDDGEVDTVEVS